MKKERQQTYNVIFIWDKRPNLNPKSNFKLFFNFILILSNFDYGQFQCNNERSYPWFDD